MDITRMQVGIYEVIFVNECKGNRSGFKHCSTLFINDIEKAKASCQYYNRTWESYTYKSSMLCAVSRRVDEIKDRITARYKKDNDVKRLTAKHKEELEKLFDNELEITICDGIIKKLNER